MRENTGRRTVETTNLIDGYSATTRWEQSQTGQAEDIISDYSVVHLEMDLDVNGYREDVQVWEYREAGLRVVALVRNGAVETVFMVSDDDVARYHTAARTGRTMKIRYVKPTESGTEVSLREIEVTSVRLTKAGHVNVRAHDRRKDDGRTFRADRITHSTLHRASAPARPNKAALAAAFQAYTAPVTVTIPAPRKAVEESAAWYLYDTTPGSPAALEAPESVQDQLAEAFASGSRYVKVYA
jgi:WYL domain